MSTKNLKSKTNVTNVCMVFGYSRDCESLSAAKMRAKRASKILIKFAQEHKDVVLIGHGFFNILIAKELQENGWNSDGKASSKHWQSNTYIMKEQ